MDVAVPAREQVRGWIARRVEADEQMRAALNELGRELLSGSGHS
jgi:hypothetical protein